MRGNSTENAERKKKRDLSIKGSGLTRAFAERDRARRLSRELHSGWGSNLNHGLRPTASRWDRRLNEEPTRLRNPVHWLKIEKIGVSEPISFELTTKQTTTLTRRKCMKNVLNLKGVTIHSGWVLIRFTIPRLWFSSRKFWTKFPINNFCAN